MNNSARLSAQVLDETTKGIPVGLAPVSIDDIASCNLSPNDGRMQYPVLTVNEAAMRDNLAEMLDFAAYHNASLAPHGKTPMSPKIASWLVESGCWGISAASVQQLAVFLRAGVSNMILANQVGGAGSARQLVDLASHYENARIWVFVDSVASVKAFQGSLEGIRNIELLVETGLRGGRNGARELATVEDVISIICELFGTDSIGGIGSYEGAALGQDPAESARKIEALLEFTVQSLKLARSARPHGEMILSAGGSAAYDIVAKILGPAARSLDSVRLVMRGGAFLFHDHGIYVSLLEDMDDRGGFNRGDLVKSAVQAFTPALRLWAQITTRPEPSLAIAGFGMRDTSHDLDLPIVLSVFRDGNQIHEFKPRNAPIAVDKLNDQHAFLSLPKEFDLAVGDIVECGISHPCTCLDKWRVIFGIDDAGRVVSAYPTCF